MVKRRRIVLAGFLLFTLIGVLVGFAWLPWRSHGPEPVYQGKPFSYWITVLELNPKGVYWREMGSNAFPILLKAVEVRNNPVQAAYRKIRPKLPLWLRKRWPRPVDAPTVRTNAAILLGEVGDSDFHIHMLKTHPDPLVRAVAAMKLGLDYSNDKATRALAEALPQEKDPQTQVTIAYGLCYTDENALIAVPALIEGLGNKNPMVRQIVAGMLTGTSIEDSAAANVVSAYNESPKAKQEAIQELLKALNDKDSAVHEAAAVWLWKIDRQAAAKAGVK